MAEAEKAKKSVTLSTDFQVELEKNKRKTNWLGIIGLFVVSIFGLTILGFGSYQIFFKPEEVEQNSGVKIESKPTESKENPTGAAKPESTNQSAPTVKTQSTPEEYTIMEGDNLGSIAVKFETTVEKLKTANNIQDETALQIGQKIKIVK
ncbi:MAG: LysM peptidoglycan-binding domain-containing protein [bacterium]